MNKEIFGRPLAFALRLIGTWPGYGELLSPFIIWILMFLTMSVQFYDVFDGNKRLNELMESTATTVTHVLSFTKIFLLWINRRTIQDCLEMSEEDWKRVTNKTHLTLMSRNAKIARWFCLWVIVSYHSSVVTFFAATVSQYTPGDPNIEKRTFMVKAKYPFNAFESPIYETLVVTGIPQGCLIVFGNFIADSFLIALVAHVSGQLSILGDRILHLSDPKEIPGIVENHKRIIHFAENIRSIFRWIGISQFLTGSIIICALGYMVINNLASDLGGAVKVKFVSYIIAMTFGVFIYGCAGNILIEESLAICDAVNESHWVDLPPQTNKMLILIMMRANKPLCITAGDFFAMNYESFMTIMKTAISYLSVIRARNE